MCLYILFGLSGAGKTFVGNIFQDSFDFHFYEGDKDLTEEMKEAIHTKTVFTDKMRDVFFQKLLQSTKKLISQHKRLVISQTFIKEKYRTLFLNEIPDVKFILIDTNSQLRESRLKKRIDSVLDIEYTRIMCRNFEKPKIDHQIISNNSEGKEEVKKQISLLFND